MKRIEERLKLRDTRGNTNKQEFKRIDKEKEEDIIKCMNS